MPRLREERLVRLQSELERSGPRGAAHLRLPQHSLHDRHPYWHLGHGQAHSLRTAATRREAHHLGLRLGCPSPPALQPVARPACRSARTALRCPTTARGRDLHAARVPFHPDADRAGTVAAKIKEVLHQYGLAERARSASTSMEMPVLAAFAKEGITWSTASRCSSRRGASRPRTR